MIANQSIRDGSAFPLACERWNRPWLFACLLSSLAYLCTCLIRFAVGRQTSQRAANGLWSSLCPREPWSAFPCPVPALRTGRHRARVRAPYKLSPWPRIGSCEKERFAVSTARRLCRPACLGHRICPKHYLARRLVMFSAKSCTAPDTRSSAPVALWRRPGGSTLGTQRMLPRAGIISRCCYWVFSPAGRVSSLPS